MVKISKVILALALGFCSVAMVADHVELSIHSHKHGEFDGYAQVKNGEFTITRYYKKNHKGQIYELEYKGTRTIEEGRTLKLSPKAAEKKFHELEQEYDAQYVKDHPEKCPVFPEIPAVPAGYKPLSSGVAPMEMEMSEVPLQKPAATKSLFKIIFGNFSGCVVTDKE